jgi:hypothetical protein
LRHVHERGSSAGIALAKEEAMTETQTPRSNARSGSERIRGRQHGFDIEWSRDRFAELIRHEVAARTDQRWAADRIWRRLRSLYEFDERSTGEARQVFDQLLGEFRGQAQFKQPRSR